jgi:acyl-CoA dehydrogenase
MVDFELTQADQEVLAEARRQAKIYRENARRIDHTMDFTRPDYAEQLKAPGEENFVHVRNMAAEREEETSGLAILEALIYLEESYGLKPVYWRGKGADVLNVSLAGKLIEIIGTPEQVEYWKDKYPAWGMTEPNAGSDPASLRTTAVFDSKTQEWVINGEKIFTSNATQADGVMALCRCHGPEGDEGIGIVLVEKGTPGYTISPQMEKLGLRNWDTVGVSFMDCRVPANARLRGNLKSALSIFNGTRGVIAAQALGYAKIAMDLVRERLASLGRNLDYSQDLIDRSAIEDRLLKLEALWEATYLTVLHTQWHGQTHGADKFYPSLAKMKGGLAVRKIIPECLNILGLLGTSENYAVEQALRDSRILDIYEGPNEAQRLLLGRALLNYTAKELN